jgi:hypothetical protein
MQIHVDVSNQWGDVFDVRLHARTSLTGVGPWVLGSFSWTSVVADHFANYNVSNIHIDSIYVAGASTLL